MTLYNAKKVEDALRITKFDEDLEVESSYITSRSTCECPAGVRDTCRHRQMYPAFISKKRFDTSWFFDWDLHQWYYYDQETGLLTDQPTMQEISDEIEASEREFRPARPWRRL